MTVIAPTATRVDITCRLGDSFTLTFPILDSSSNPTPISGWSVHAQVRYAAADTLLYEWATNPTETQGTATISDTTVVLTFDGNTTRAWAWRRPAQFELVITEPGGTAGTPHVVAAGQFRVIPAINQA